MVWAICRRTPISWSNQINTLQAELVLRNAKVVGSTPIGSTNSLNYLCVSVVKTCDALW